MSLIMSVKDAERAKQLYNDASHSVQGQGRSSVFVRPDDPGTEVLIDTVPQIKGTNVDIEFPDYREGSKRPADAALAGWYRAEDGVYDDSPGKSRFERHT